MTMTMYEDAGPIELRKKKASLKRLLERYARKLETQKNPVSLPYIQTPSTLAGMVEVVSNLRGQDAKWAAEEINKAEFADQGTALLAESVAKNEVAFKHAEFYRCMVDMELFAQKYLSRHFTNTIIDPVTKREHIFHPNFHGDLAKQLMKIAYRQITTPLVVAGFPECGKSTMCTFLFPIHNVCHGAFIAMPDGTGFDLTKRFHLYVSAIDPTARRLLNRVLDQFETNEKIIDDYGHLYEDPSGAGSKGGARGREWSVGRATTTNGVHLEAKSRRGKFRTLIWREYRPDLGIADDIETDDGVRSRKEREKTQHFFFNVFTPRFSENRGNVIILGNILDEQSLMANLVKHGKRAGWETRVYKLYETEKETKKKIYLMPEHYGENWEKTRRTQLMGNQVSFNQEFLQDPAAGDSELTQDSFGYYDPEELRKIPKEEQLDYFAVDPATTESLRSDFTAIVGVAFVESTRMAYVLPAIEKRLSVSDQVGAITNVWLVHDPYVLGVEAVGYQKVLKALVEDAAQEDGHTIDVREVIQDARRTKFNRIRRLFPPIKAKRLLFLQDNPEHKNMIDQLISISREVEPDYDDLADGLEMCVRMRDEDVRKELEEGESDAEAEVAGGTVPVPDKKENPARKNETEDESKEQEKNIATGSSFAVSIAGPGFAKEQKKRERSPHTQFEDTHGEKNPARG